MKTRLAAILTLVLALLAALATTSKGDDRSATPSTLAAVLNAAQPGDTILLATGSYGTFTGTNKAITLKAAPGASPGMRFAFTTGDSGFTLDGITAAGGTFSGTAHDITVRNAAFTSTIDFTGPLSGIVVENSTMAWNATGTSTCCKVTVDSTSGTLAAPAVTLRGNAFRGGQLDGIQVRDRTQGLIVDANTFTDMCDVGQNHTDAIQFYGSGVTQVQVSRNYIREAAGCNGALQGISSYDGGTVGVLIEDNALDLHRPWGIELYADKGSVVRHNTLRYYPKTNCAFNIECGQIDIGRKSSSPVGTGTQVLDNVTTGASFSSGSTGTQRGNVSGLNASYVAVNPTTWAGYALALGSPGKAAASDGLDVGIRAGVSPEPTPSATPSATASPTVTAEPTVSPSPTATATAVPTATPVETSTPAPTATPYRPACSPDCDATIAGLRARIAAALAALS